MHRQAPKAPSFGILKQTAPGRNRPARLSQAVSTQPGPKSDLRAGALLCLIELLHQRLSAEGDGRLRPPTGGRLGRASRVVAEPACPSTSRSAFADLRSAVLNPSVNR